MKKCCLGVIAAVCVDYQPLSTKHFTSCSARRACRGASTIARQQKTYKKRKAKEKTTKRHERQILPCKRIDPMILWLHIDVMVFFICLEMLFPAHFSACCKHSFFARPAGLLYRIQPCTPLSQFLVTVLYSLCAQIPIMLHSPVKSQSLKVFPRKACSV